MIIYKATNSINNKSYIGQTIHNLNDRMGAHFQEAKKDNLPFHNALLKYKHEFIWEKIDQCDSKEELDEMEFHYIKQYDTLFPNGYNMTLGGEGTHGWKPSNDTKKKIGLKQKGRKKSIEEIEKHRSSIKKIWKDKNSIYNSIEYREKLRKSISNSLTGRKLSKKHKENISKGTKGSYKHTEEFKNKIRQRQLGSNNSWSLKNITKEQLENKSKFVYKIISENGIEIIIKVLSIWCRENNINYEKFRSYINKNKFCFGYKVERLRG